MTAARAWWQESVTPGARAALVDAVRRSFRARYRGTDETQACLYWAEAAAVVLARRLGEPVIIQAGTAAWRCGGTDDGHSPTHFSYAFDPHRARYPLLLGLLPEMHVWAGIPRTQEVVDLTTCYLVGQCHRLTPHAWTAAEPPPFLWAHELPAGAHYAPDPTATAIAHRLLAEDSMFPEYQ